METRQIMVIVEEADVSKAALQWALHNILRYGDQIILVHVFTPTRSSRNNKKLRLLRLKGFQLALDFKGVCDKSVLDVKVEIIVREGDQEGKTIATMVTEIGASDLVLGLHDHSFLYRMGMTHASFKEKLNCRVFVIRQPVPKSLCILPILDFSLIDVPSITRPKNRYQFLQSLFDIIWRPKQRRRRKCITRLHTSARRWTLFSND